MGVVQNKSETLSEDVTLVVEREHEKDEPVSEERIGVTIKWESGYAYANISQKEAKALVKALTMLIEIE